MEINCLTVLVSGNYNAFNEGFNAAGSYMISGLQPSNTFSRPIYIGSTVNLKKRTISDHFLDLKKNQHCNAPLQNYYNKHGVENIIVFLLESCPPLDILNIEQKYLDLYRPFADEMGGFNILKFASSTTGYKHSEETRKKLKAIQTPERRKAMSDLFKGKKASPETIEKLSKSHLGIIPSLETRLKRSLALKGRKRPKEVGENISKAKSKPFPDIINIYTGEIVKNGINAKKFCESRGICYRVFWVMLSGRGKTSYGWKLYEQSTK